MTLEEKIKIVELIPEVIIALCAIVALKQINIAKKDIKTRSQREAITLAINQVEYFRSEIIKSNGNIDKALESIDKNVRHSYYFPKRKIELEKFTLKEIEERNLSTEYNEMLKFISDNKLLMNIREIANKIEYFSLAFTSKAADEEVAFNPTADVLTNFIDRNYAYYCHARKNNDRIFHSSITLYKFWKAKINKKNIELKREDFEKEIKEELKKNDKNLEEDITPVGV